MLAMPRFEDAAICMQELLGGRAEQLVNAVMDDEADQLCGGGSKGRNVLPRVPPRHLRQHVAAAHSDAPIVRFSR